MLCGPHPNSRRCEPRFVLNWYQVLSIEAKGLQMVPDSIGKTAAVVTVRGPQWPWQPGEYQRLSNNLCVAICRGAVAVHRKRCGWKAPRGSTVQSFGSAASIQARITAVYISLIPADGPWA